MTACLMVSLLAISIVARTSPNRSPNASRIEFQVSEAFSRTTKGSRINRFSGMAFTPTSGCVGAATIT